jgi:hypothetical protein
VDAAIEHRGDVRMVQSPFQRKDSTVFCLWPPSNSDYVFVYQTDFGHIERHIDG